MQQLNISPLGDLATSYQQTLWKARVVLLKVGQQPPVEWMEPVAAHLHKAFDLQEMCADSPEQGQFLRGEVGSMLLCYGGEDAQLEATIAHALARSEGVPLVVLSLNPSVSQAVLALKAGAADYVSAAGLDAEHLGLELVRSLHDCLPVPAWAPGTGWEEAEERTPLALVGERMPASQFSTQAAHEILTPLAALQEFIALVLDGVAGPVADEQGKYLAYARGACVQIRQAVDRLVEAEEVGDAHMATAPQTIEALVLDAWSAVAETQPDWDLRVEIEDIAQRTSAAANPGKLQQLLFTLFQDLLSVSDPSTTVAIVARLTQPSSSDSFRLCLETEHLNQDQQLAEPKTSHHQLGPWIVSQTIGTGLSYQLELPTITG